MDYQKLADLLFPNVTMTREELEAKYPPRDLPEGARVTRIAPSPTGWIHLGALFQAVVNERLAHQSGGVFYLRIEDTDGRREVEGADEGIVRTMARFGVRFDEGLTVDENGAIVERGAYGPYRQTERTEIYHVYAKWLVEQGKAYPVFATQEELDALMELDKKAEVKAREWTPEMEAAQKEEMLRLRNFTLEEVEQRLKKGDKFVLRLLANGDPEKKIRFNDLLKGTLELPENDKDEVLLKSNGIPTYHFAHAVDDHLMRTTLVIRGEEWLGSVSRHVMLFSYLGFRMPKYLHTATILQLDENHNKKKLSKRDDSANLADYLRRGYTTECMMEYVMTLLNSNYEEWRMQNPDKPMTDFPFSVKKMSASGCLLDFDKLTDISKNVLSRMSVEEIYEKTTQWATEFDPAFAAHLTADPVYAKKIFAIGRGGKKPRKDFATLSEVKPFLGFFYDDYFRIEDAYDPKFDKEDIKATFRQFLASYDEEDDSNAWFEKVQAIGASLGYTPNMKEYKANPGAFKGNVGDISMFLRVAVTGRLNSPDLYTVMRILGKDRVAARIEQMCRSL